ncbi:hypothetical protein [Deinococcus misasensis]|uniref:hypothetical protein n=1 Tax=Deinococcus misasensis TaxID=392413 RepID=UPI000554AF0C|nr:hypothetical protein [Deinococcus misasensis]
MTGSAHDWNDMDELLFKVRRIPFLVLYRQLTGCSLPEAIDKMAERMTLLRGLYPERFPVPVDPVEEAWKNLRYIQETVLAIEAVWDGDTFHNWFLELMAIVEKPSDAHPRYTAVYLCTLYSSTHELAAEVGAEVHLHRWPPDDAYPRWWDGPEKEDPR